MQDLLAPSRSKILRTRQLITGLQETSNGHKVLEERRGPHITWPAYGIKDEMDGNHPYDFDISLVQGHAQMLNSSSKLNDYIEEFEGLHNRKPNVLDLMGPGEFTVNRSCNQVVGFTLVDPYKKESKKADENQTVIEGDIFADDAIKKIKAVMQEKQIANFDLILFRPFGPRTMGPSCGIGDSYEVDLLDRNFYKYLQEFYKLLNPESGVGFFSKLDPDDKDAYSRRLAPKVKALGNLLRRHGINFGMSKPGQFFMIQKTIDATHELPSFKEVADEFNSNYVDKIKNLGENLAQKLKASFLAISKFIDTLVKNPEAKANGQIDIASKTLERQNDIFSSYFKFPIEVVKKMVNENKENLFGIANNAVIKIMQAQSYAKEAEAKMNEAIKKGLDASYLSATKNFISLTENFTKPFIKAAKEKLGADQFDNALQWLLR